MSSIIFSPSWFAGYDIMLRLSFAIITFIVSLFAFKIYKVSNLKQVKLFGVAFLLISISYFVQSIFNFLALYGQNIILNIGRLGIFGTYLYMALMTCGLVVLIYATCKTANKRNLLMLLSISFLGIFLSMNSYYMFFLFSAIYLFFLSWHFIENYLQNKQAKTLLIAIAFLFLMFSNFHFLISVNHQFFYVIGHVLELFAYLLILWNFYLVLK